MNRKYGSDYDLYELSRKHRGKEGTSKEMARLFGILETTYIYKSRIYKFLEHIAYKHPRSYWRVRDVIALTRDNLNELGIPGNAYAHCGTFRHKGINYFLIDSEYIPFWKVKEYGGKY
jgi:hypothetical protein